MPVDEHLRLADETQKVDVYWGRNYDMADMVFAYVPSEKLVIDRRAENLPGALGVARAPGTCSPMSRRRSCSKEAPRARQHCADELEKGNYWPGCPIQSKYY
jgi:hypothetical protein